MVPCRDPGVVGAQVVGDAGEVLKYREPAVLPDEEEALQYQFVKNWYEQTNYHYCM